MLRSHSDAIHHFKNTEEGVNEQMTLFKEKQKIVEAFIKRVNPYEKHEPLSIDLRGYAKYLKEHNIDGKKPNDIVEMFKIQ